MLWLQGHSGSCILVGVWILAPLSPSFLSRMPERLESLWVGISLMSPYV